ncbi:hypothetical protein FHS85_000315 [Rhodoligotrophos appendicifer]|uniref:DUF4286 family protein n=1 Tax=Rhodoligotrophos appendicifer TaxID=987056 RepID=UPI00118155B7|nr:DUF4286 family protein [Rhodoligotrophos appendicifer]
MKAGGLLGQALLVTLTDVSQEDVRDFNQWYNREHIDDLLNVAGFRRARRYAGEAMKPRFMALYEVEDIDVLTSPAYFELLANQSAWSRKIIGRFTYHRRLCATVTVDFARGLGGAVGIIRLPVPPDIVRVRELLSETGFPEVIDRCGMHGALLAECDLDAVNAPITQLGLTLPAATEPECLVIVEGEDTKSTTAAIDHLVAQLRAILSKDHRLLTGSYSLLYANQRSFRNNQAGS